MNLTNIQNIEYNLKCSKKIYETYVYLLNSYVLDFFTENHWNKLLSSWQTFFESFSFIEIANLLTEGDKIEGKVWPLSLLSLRRLLFDLSIPRNVIKLQTQNPFFINDDKLPHLFWKNVKFKKRHEIGVMSKICYQSAFDTDCFYIVDLGSGLGHLSRILNYGYGFNVCTIEAQKELSDQAKVLDNEFERNLCRKFSNHQKYNKTIHLNWKVPSHVTAVDFWDTVKNAFSFPNDNCQFGIVGLHPCGDLGATLLRLYTECENIKYINIVGCCYMKLTKNGFPLSGFCLGNNYELSYHSREIACHAIENYVEKLRIGEQWRLKVHTYRAVLEKIIVNNFPNHHHCALSSVKYSEGLTFEDYCSRAVKSLGISIPENIINNENNNELLLQWQKVVIFYSLRLMFAPMVESIVLLDRLLYLFEGSSICRILSVFDPNISPRCHVLAAKKK